MVLGENSKFNQILLPAPCREMGADLAINVEYQQG